MKINKLFKPGFILFFMVSILVTGFTQVEAQRGGYMMGRQYEQGPDQRWELYGPGMTGRHGIFDPGMGIMPGTGMSEFLGLPGLTDAQRDEISTILRGVRREHREIMLDMMDRRDDYMDEMTSDRPDPDRVSRLHEAMSQKQREMIRSSVETRNRIYDLLTEDQRAQFREFQRRPFDHPYRQRWE